MAVNTTDSLTRGYIPATPMGTGPAGLPEQPVMARDTANQPKTQASPPVVNPAAPTEPPLHSEKTPAGTPFGSPTGLSEREGNIPRDPPATPPGAKETGTFTVNPGPNDLRRAPGPNDPGQRPDRPFSDAAPSSARAAHDAEVARVRAAQKGVGQGSAATVVTAPAPVDTSFHPEAIGGLQQGLKLIGRLAPFINNAQSAGQAGDAIRALGAAFEQLSMICTAIQNGDAHAASRVNGAIGQLAAVIAGWENRQGAL